jgi:PIN domain nuclease of toxin-antitoxin system
MILTDTHVIVWLASDDRRLPHAARDALMSSASFDVSAIIAWEFVELQLRGRLPVTRSFAEIQTGLGFTVQPLPDQFWTIATNLPQIHKDPIDRMLVAHALASGATLATADANIKRYPVKTLW